ncbi:MAG: hypothetical protein IT459_07135 [Planctomycetes bacterium]|nr:hypothetical protein [Planctomycetota bacterium]
MNVWIAAGCVVAWCATLAQDRIEPQLELYDVRDFVTPNDPALRDESALEFLRTVLERAAIAESPDARITCANGALVVRGSKEDQRAVGAYLTRIRQDTRRTFTVKAALVEIGPSPAGALVTVKADLPIVRELFDAPGVVVGALTRGHVDATRTTEFISGYRVHHDVLPLQGRVVVPQIESFASGATLDATVAPLRGDALAVKVRVQHVAAEAPVTTETTELGPIAVPKLRTSTVESVLELEPGSAALLPLPGTGEPRTAFLIEVFANE